MKRLKEYLRDSLLVEWCSVVVKKGFQELGTVFQYTALL